MKKIKSNL